MVLPHFWTDCTKRNYAPASHIKAMAHEFKRDKNEPPLQANHETFNQLTCESQICEHVGDLTPRPFYRCTANRTSDQIERCPAIMHVACYSKQYSGHSLSSCYGGVVKVRYMRDNFERFTAALTKLGREEKERMDQTEVGKVFDKIPIQVFHQKKYCDTAEGPLRCYKCNRQFHPDDQE